MTSGQFNSFKDQLYWYYSDIVKKMSDQIKIGSDYYSSLYKARVLKGYINLMDEYTPYYDYETDRNYFDKIYMKNNVLFRINELLNTNFDLDFNLE